MNEWLRQLGSSHWSHIICRTYLSPDQFAGNLMILCNPKHSPLVSSQSRRNEMFRYVASYFTSRNSEVREHKTEIMPSWVFLLSVSPECFSLSLLSVSPECFSWVSLLSVSPECLSWVSLLSVSPECLSWVSLLSVSLVLPSRRSCAQRGGSGTVQMSFSNFPIFVFSQILLLWHI